MTTAKQQMMTMKTKGDDVLIAHELANESYQPDVLIMAAGSLTRSGCRVVLGDYGSYVEK